MDFPFPIIELGSWLMIDTKIAKVFNVEYWLANTAPLCGIPYGHDVCDVHSVTASQCGVSGVGWAGSASWWSAVRVWGRMYVSWASPRLIPGGGIPLRSASGPVSRQSL